MNKIIKYLSALIISTFFIPFINYSQQTYILVGWNDLGMHCANKVFAKIAVLPPYNNVYAQLILKQPGQNPQVVNIGYKIEYYIPGNTYSVGKTDFWTYAQQLFGLPQPLPQNIGLTGHGLTGQFDTIGNGFFVSGVPLTPFADSNWNVEKPFQLIHLSAKQTQGTIVLTYTDNVIPVSNEISCIQAGCHNSEQSILNDHEPVSGFNQNGPVLCALCHASNALGTQGDPIAKPFSFRMHDAHSFIQPTNDISTCYQCHPGPNTQCLRDTMHNSNAHLICQNCHGTMQVVASSIENGRRPWLDEPKCGNITCHGSNFAEEPNKLFRQSKGHANLYCSACHGSPHAIQPSREVNDNMQNVRLQGFRGTLKDCMVCHSSPPVGAGPHGITYIGIKPISNNIPKEFKIYQNYPNPFNPSTKIKFDIPSPSDGKLSYVRLTVYDILGRQISVLVNSMLNPGNYEVQWDASRYGSGVYFYKLESNNLSLTKKMIFGK